MHKSVKPVGTRPGIMHGIYKVHKQQLDGCPHFSQFYPRSKLLNIIFNPGHNILALFDNLADVLIPTSKTTLDI